MRRFTLAALSIAFGSCALTQPACYAQKARGHGKQDEKSGTTVTYQVQSFGCGAMTVYMNCNGIPFDLNGVPAGSTWLYTSTGPNGPYGWGFFYGSNDLAGAQFQIVNSSFSPSPATFTSLPPYPTVWPPVCDGNCSAFSASISGTTPDDGGSYTATVSLNLYYYEACGSAGCREDALVTAGTISVTYQ